MKYRDYAPEFLYPDAPNNSYKTLRRDVLDSFRGIWFVTADVDGELIVTASENYWQKARGNWHTLPPKTLPNGFVINWLVRPFLEGREKAMVIIYFTNPLC